MASVATVGRKCINRPYLAAVAGEHPWPKAGGTDSLLVCYNTGFLKYCESIEEF